MTWIALSMLVLGLATSSLHGGSGCAANVAYFAPVQRSWPGWSRFAVFTGAAAATGGLFYGVIGYLGAISDAGTRVAAVLTLVLAATGGFWHSRRQRFQPWRKAGVQARRHLAARGAVGRAYFGAVLGVGVLTEITTPLVGAGLVASVALGPVAGITYGVAFGIGRAVPGFVAAVSLRGDDPKPVTEWMFGESHSTVRVLGVATALAYVAAIMYELVISPA